MSKEGLEDFGSKSIPRKVLCVPTMDFLDIKESVDGKSLSFTVDVTLHQYNLIRFMVCSNSVSPRDILSFQDLRT